jgi:catalase
MHIAKVLLPASTLLGLSSAIGCPYADPGALKARAESHENEATAEYLAQFKVDDSKDYLTSDVGGPIEDQNSLKAGVRGPTLLEDFIFRQKIQHFDHERVSTSCFYVSNAYVAIT